jgi:hypothetical protein
MSAGQFLRLKTIFHTWAAAVAALRPEWRRSVQPDADALVGDNVMASVAVRRRGALVAALRRWEATMDEPAL